MHPEFFNEGCRYAITTSYNGKLKLHFRGFVIVNGVLYIAFTKELDGGPEALCFRPNDIKAAKEIGAY